MWGHYLLTLYRALTRHRLYAALNVLGLAVGVAVFLVLALFVRFQTSFESWIPDASKIYQVRETWNLPGLPKQTYSFTMGGLLEELKADYPQLTGVRLNGNRVIVRAGAQNSFGNATYVDGNFFDVFPLPLAAGDPRTALRDTTSLVVSQKTARQYFGTSNPIGRTLTLALNGVEHNYRVTGVLKDLPPNTDLKLDMLALLVPAWFDTDHYFYHWGSSSLQTYLKFHRPEQAQALAKDLDRFIDRHGARDMGSKPAPHTFYHLDLTSLPRVHLITPADAATVATLGVVGALTLLIAVLNYVNLATAQAGLRAREVAVRKVLGGTRQALTIQFLTEAVATAALAALAGLALCEIALPVVNAAGGVFLHLDYFGAHGVLLPLAALVVVVGCGAGLYPAAILSRFQPAAVLASARTPGGGRIGGRVREALVLTQFAISTGFMICTGVLLAQTHHVQTADLGFQRSGLILATSFRSSELTVAQRASLIEAFRNSPGVVAVSQSDSAPGDDNANTNNMVREGQTGDGPSITWTITGPDYFTTYGAKLAAGRWLDRAHGLDDEAGRTPESRDAATDVVINEAAVHAFGFASPRDAIGKLVQERTSRHTWRRMPVVGVVADIRFHSPREQVRPMLYRFSSGDLNSPIAAIRYAGSDPRPVLARLQAAWRQVAPTVPFEATTVAENLSAYYRPDAQRARLFTMGAVLAVAIGCVGLYGLASFTTARRVKEIGIRKTLGASTSDIVKLLIGQFLRPVLLANLIAWPLAWLVMQNWLSGFDQRIGLGPQYFLAATALTLLIALGTVAGQALGVARAEPAKALRHE
jgi:putative ABC transport system permease protein